MTREQANTILRLTKTRSCLRDGYADHHIDVTLPGGECWRVNEDGIEKLTQPNHSIDWTQ